MLHRQPIASFAYLKRLISELPGPDLSSIGSCLAHESTLIKPACSLGRLEELSLWLAAWQGRHPPTFKKARTAIFAANHGVTARGVSAYPQEVTAQMVRNFMNGGAAINQLCRAFDSELRVYELDLDRPTQDFTTEGPAMSEVECAQAIAYGMTCVDSSLDVLALGEMGIGNTTSSAALCHGLFGGSPAEWTGAGTGVFGAAYEAKVAVVEEARAIHADHCKDGLDWLAAVGGREMAAIVGAIIAARLARVPVILDGFVCTSAAAVLWSLNPEMLDHCRVAHLAPELGHARLCGKLGQTPLLDLGMRLGEGSGSTLALSLVKGAVACHEGMKNFEDAGVSGPI